MVEGNENVVEESKIEKNEKMSEGEGVQKEKSRNREKEMKSTVQN
jgi:hypothetical protein